MKIKRILYSSAATGAALLAAFSAQAANFEITNGQTVGAQSIGAGASQTGIVDTGGTISVNGAAAATSSSASGILTNNGTLTLTGSNAFGLNATANSNTLTNNGTITGNGFNDDGIIANNSTTNTTLTNNGTITESGVFADGMGTGTGGSGHTIINNGTIITTGGSGTDAINNFADNSTITNNGIASSTGAPAIQNSGSGNTVILRPNSQTLGGIGFSGSGNFLQYDLNTGAREGGSVILVTGSVTGSPTTQIINTSGLGHAVVAQSGNTLAVVTPDNVAVTDQVVNQTLNYTNDLVNQRQQLALLGDTTGVASGTQYAASNASSNDANPASSWGIQNKKTFWAEGFGTYQERPKNGDSDYSQSSAGGALAGVDLPQTDAGYRAGFYVGGFAGSQDIGRTTFRSIGSSGALAGGYLGKSYGHLYVSGQLATGYSDNDSSRSTGVDVASANYNSFFISPSVTVMRPYVATGVTWIPTATLRYTAQFDDSYAETGSAANQNVGSKMLNELDARLLLEAHLDSKHYQSGSFTPAFRAGIEGQTLVGSRSTNVTALGTNINFDPSGGDNYIDGVLGVNLAYAFNNGPLLYLDGETDIGINKGGPSDNIGVTGRLGARWKF